MKKRTLALAAAFALAAVATGCSGQEKETETQSAALSQAEDGAEGESAGAAGTDEDQGSHCDFDTDIIVTTLDEDISEPLTLIKADIEGFEQKALLGARRHIAEDHPKLLISVYHSNEDLWKIPKMIDEMAEGYDFYLRFKGSPIYPTEITLIAV